MTLKEGQGRIYLSVHGCIPLAWVRVLICSYKGRDCAAAPALATASETAKTAFAPNLFFGHPY